MLRLLVAPALGLALVIFVPLVAPVLLAWVILRAASRALRAAVVVRFAHPSHTCDADPRLRRGQS